MRAERVEGTAAGIEIPQGVLWDFAPAILSGPEDLGCGSYREPRWYAVRFGQISEPLVLRLLDLILLPYHIFTYQHQTGRHRTTTRSWLPGYMFVEFDPSDNWRQLLLIPGVIEVLGSPTPLADGVIEDLLTRLPRRLPKNTAHTVIPVGSAVRVKDGPFSGVEAKVIEIKDDDHVCAMWMMLGALREQVFRVADLEVVS
jgi:transcription antitermination factor NusG